MLDDLLVLCPAFEIVMRFLVCYELDSWSHQYLTLWFILHPDHLDLLLWIFIQQVTKHLVSDSHLCSYTDQYMFWHAGKEFRFTMHQKLGSTLRRRIGFERVAFFCQRSIKSSQLTTVVHSIEVRGNQLGSTPRQRMCFDPAFLMACETATWRSS